MVSGSSRTDHWSRRWRLRSGCAGDGAGSYSADPERWRATHLRLSRSDLSHHHDGDWFLYAEPSGWVEAGWMDAYCHGEPAASGKGLHAWRCPEDLAMVGIVAAPVSKYLRGYLAHLARVADVSGDRQGKRYRCRRHGGHRQYRQRGRS